MPVGRLNLIFFGDRLATAVTILSKSGETRDLDLTVDRVHRCEISVFLPASVRIPRATQSASTLHALDRTTKCCVGTAVLVAAHIGHRIGEVANAVAVRRQAMLFRGISSAAFVDLPCMC